MLEELNGLLKNFKEKNSLDDISLLILLNDYCESTLLDITADVFHFEFDENKE